MSITKTSGGVIAVTTMSIVISGCAATQAAAFRHMSAAEHEQAAQLAQGSEGATAAEHLMAAKQLRDAELAACTEVPDAERALGPFARRDQIVGIEEVRERLFPKAPPQPFGITVYIRATPGLTQQWIGREVECSLAHYAAAGASEGSGSSPLSENVKVVVSSTRAGFRVSITSPDIDIARRVIHKGHSLGPIAS